MGAEAAEDALDLAAADEEEVGLVVLDGLLDAGKKRGRLFDEERGRAGDRGGSIGVVFARDAFGEVMGHLGGTGFKAGGLGADVNDVKGNGESVGDADSHTENRLGLLAAIDSAEDAAGSVGVGKLSQVGAGPDGNFAVVEDAGGNAAEQELAEAGIAEGGHHDEVDGIVLGITDNGGGGGGLDLDALELDAGEGAGQEIGDAAPTGLAEQFELEIQGKRLEGVNAWALEGVEHGDAGAELPGPGPDGRTKFGTGAGEVDWEQNVLDHGRSPPRAMLPSG